MRNLGNMPDESPLIRVHPESEQDSLALSPATLAWLDTLGQARPAPSSSSGHCIVYVLSAADAHLQLFKARSLNNGGYSHAEPIRPDFHRLTWGNVPAYYQTADLPILRLFLALQDNVILSIQSSLALRGEEGAQLVRMALRTGRLHLESIDQPALSAGVRFSAGLFWQAGADGRQQLRLNSQEAMILLPT